MNWTFSASPTGTPGQPEDSVVRDSYDGNVRLSEVAFEDGKIIWVELHNAARSAIDLTDLQLANNNDFTNKIMLEGTLDAGSYKAFASEFPLDKNGEFSLFLVGLCQ